MGERCLSAWLPLDYLNFSKTLPFWVRWSSQRCIFYNFFLETVLLKRVLSSKSLFSIKYCNVYEIWRNFEQMLNLDGNIVQNQKHFRNYFYLHNFYFHYHPSKNKIWIILACSFLGFWWRFKNFSRGHINFLTNRSNSDAAPQYRQME
jgi:hypothetical protein